MSNNIFPPICTNSSIELYLIGIMIYTIYCSPYINI
nr:MAG TPA: hypothetical protein [Caudoviricetes sp.]